MTDHYDAISYLGLLRRDEPGPAAVPDVTAPVPEPHLM
jgi:hypothetical protein